MNETFHIIPKGKSLKQKLDYIDHEIVKNVYDQYLQSRLKIICGMWFKGEAVAGQYRGVNCPSYRELENETERSHHSLKRWHGLYKKWPEYDVFYKEYAEIKAKEWAQKALGMNQKEQKETPLLPEGKYSIFYADPPWLYGDKLIDGYGAAEHHYPAMSIEKLCSLPIKEIVGDNAVLFLWVTSPILEECFDIIKAWGFCCATGTKILTNDLRWVNAENLNIGDRLLTFDEQRRNGRRYFKWGMVLDTGIESHPCYEIELVNGKKIICTGEHSWLMRTSITGRESSHRWIKTCDIESHMNHHARKCPLGISRLVPITETDSSYESGFLAGAFDAEGSWRLKKGGLMFAQSDNALMQHVKSFLQLKKYDFGDYGNKTNNVRQLGLRGGLDESLRFMMEFRPPRLIDNWLKTDVSKISLYNRQTDSIKAIKKVGNHDVVVLATDTKTYFADGYGAHNTYKAQFIWDKVKHNYGHYNSVRHELLLICTKGSCLPDSNKLIDSVQSIEKTSKHSEKPSEFRKIIDELYSNGRRIELFARGEIPSGWETWGNEAARTN